MKITGRPSPKKNNRRIFNRGGKTISIPSKAYENYKELALWQLKAYKERHTGPMIVDMTFQIKGKYRVDLDNLVTAVLDILQEAKIIDDDNNVVSLAATKNGGFKDWVTHITITSS